MEEEEEMEYLGSKVKILLELESEEKLGVLPLCFRLFTLNELPNSIKELRQSCTTYCLTSHIKDYSALRELLRKPLTILNPLTGTIDSMSQPFCSEIEDLAPSPDSIFVKPSADLTSNAVAVLSSGGWQVSRCTISRYSGLQSHTRRTKVFGRARHEACHLLHLNSGRKLHFPTPMVQGEKKKRTSLILVDHEREGLENVSTLMAALQVMRGNKSRIGNTTVPKNSQVKGRALSFRLQLKM